MGTAPLDVTVIARSPKGDVAIQQMKRGAL
jgi:hypothetical protein